LALSCKQDSGVQSAGFIDFAGICRILFSVLICKYFVCALTDSGSEIGEGNPEILTMALRRKYGK